MLSEPVPRPESQLLSTEGLELTAIPHERSSLAGRTDLSELPPATSHFQLEELQLQLQQADQRVRQLGELCRNKDLEIVGLERDIERKRQEVQREKDTFAQLTFRILTLKQESSDVQDAELLRLRQELARLNQPLPAVPSASVSDLAETRQRLTLQNIETREMEQSLSTLQASIQKARADSTLLKHMNEELRKTLTAAEANAAELGTLVTRQAEELERAKATLLQEQLKTSEMKSEALVHSKGKPTSRRAPLWARTLPRASSATARQLTIPLALLTDRDSDSSKTTPRITFPQRHPKTTR